MVTIPDVAGLTDHYFLRTKAVIERFGDQRVTYAVFLRRPVLAACRLAVELLETVADARGTRFEIEQTRSEGTEIGAGEPLLYITGSFRELVDLETLYLQRLGAACVAAYQAREMCRALPRVGFLAMDARHCAGSEMADMMAYAASVGSRAAQREGALGFIGNATEATAGWFGQPHGLGTMPHALIGYAGSTLRAAQMYRASFPGEPMTVLIDYFGQETTDALSVCAAFPELAEAGELAFRLDTHGGRYVEGLDHDRSYAILLAKAPKALRAYRTDTELRHLVGPGVSAAAMWHVRETLDHAGYARVRLVGSGGFSADKCRTMALVDAPIDIVGTGSFLPESWTETYATADIIAYDGVPRVKLGREFLLRSPAHADALPVCA
jgi:nicotinate phosphoribosyltransferase